MSVMRVWVVASALALAWGLSAAPARADTRPAPPGRAQPAPQAGVRVSLDQAVKMVESRFKARVVRAETRRQGGKVIYVMRVLDQHGRVFTVQVDASSGTIL